MLFKEYNRLSKKKLFSKHIIMGSLSLFRLKKETKAIKDF